MKIYTTHNKKRLRWVFGLILFALALGITTASVHGFSNSPRSANRYNQNQNNQPRNYNQNHNDMSLSQNCGDDNPPQVPEPTTWLLLGSGVAAAFAIKRMAK